MSYHHYYDTDFFGHLREVNPKLAIKLREMRDRTEAERTRLTHEYYEALDVALKENLEALKPHLRPCHRRDVDEGKPLRVKSYLHF